MAFMFKKKILKIRIAIIFKRITQLHSVSLSNSHTQIRVIFLYWLPCILRMQRPGQVGYECPPPPSSSSSSASGEKKQQIQNVELKERYARHVAPRSPMPPYHPHNTLGPQKCF